jgi:hypothetical protein
MRTVRNVETTSYARSELHDVDGAGWLLVSDTTNVTLVQQVGRWRPQNCDNDDRPRLLRAGPIIRVVDVDHRTGPLRPVLL